MSMIDLYFTAIPYRASTGPEQGFPCVLFPHREKPVFITGFPANENRFFPVWKYYTGKTLFWPCTGPVRDCSEVRNRCPRIIPSVLT